MDYYNATGIFDNSTYNNFGRYQNGLNYTNLATGKRGQALQLDGVDDNIFLGTTFGNMGGSNFTLSAWVKTNITGAQGIMGKYASGQTWFYFRLDDDNKPAGAMGFAIGSPVHTYANAPVQLNQWYHLVYVVNRNGSMFLCKRDITNR